MPFSARYASSSSALFRYTASVLSETLRDSRDSIQDPISVPSGVAVIRCMDGMLSDAWQREVRHPRSDPLSAPGSGMPDLGLYGSTAPKPRKLSAPFKRPSAVQQHELRAWTDPREDQPWKTA